MGHGFSCPLACGILPDHRWNPCLTALAGSFLSTVPPGKSCDLVLKYLDICCLGHFCESLLWSGPAQDLKSSLTSVFLGLFSLVLICYLFIYWIISHTTLFLPCFLLYNFLCISFLSFPKPAFPSRTETLLCELVYFLLPRTEHVHWLVWCAASWVPQTVTVIKHFLYVIWYNILWEILSSARSSSSHFVLIALKIIQQLTHNVYML